MDYTLTNQNLVVLNGGGQTNATGHQSHYPIYKDDAGVEYIWYQNRYQKISDLNLNIRRREVVDRG